MYVIVITGHLTVIHHQSHEMERFCPHFKVSENINILLNGEKQPFFLNYYICFGIICIQCCIQWKTEHLRAYDTTKIGNTTLSLQK